MTTFRKVIPILYLLIFAVWSTHAQQQCTLDVENIIARVSGACEGIDSNQVCYGNRNVTATPQENAREFIFNQPGDLVNLSSIQSLIVETVNAQEDTWGVAQMNLLVGSDRGLQDVSMLLFGEFDVRNAVENTDTILLEVIVREKILHSRPNEQDVLDTVTLGGQLIGLARLEDSSWVRVENPETRVVGWIEAGGIEEINQFQSIGLLPVNLPEQPYFGAMQAFYFENGTSDIGCDNVESDGLIIQTPEGQARVSLLINEVSIELIGGRNRAGENVSGSAFIQANPLSPQGMSVNVLRGTASVEADGIVTSVEAGQQTSIPISVDLVALGEPQTPVEFSADTIAVEPLLPAVDSIRENRNNNNTGSSTGNNTIPVGSNTASSSSNNNGSGTDLSNVNVDTGASSGNNTNNNIGTGSGVGNTGNSSSSSSANPGGINVDTGGSSSSTGTSPINTVSTRPTNSSANFGFGEDADKIAAVLAVTGAVLLVGFLIWSARRQRSK